MSKLSQFTFIEVTQIHKLQKKVELHYDQGELELILWLLPKVVNWSNNLYLDTIIKTH